MRALILLYFLSTTCFLSIGYAAPRETQKNGVGNTTKKLTPAASAPRHLKTLVIDPGHGGMDIGARGRQSNEKTIALGIALQLRDELRRRLPNLKIVLTRSTDITQSVRRKAEIANAARGDLFISIHCNSIPAPTPKKGKAKGVSNSNLAQASGTETYIWGINKNRDKTLAMRENESLYTDKTMRKELAAFRPSDPAQRLYYELKTRQYFHRSAALAQNIEQEFGKIGRSSRLARQRTKGIWVLQATAMPSVLVETGFISNPKEEKYLMSTKGKQETARCIALAVVAYNKSLSQSTKPVKKYRFPKKQKSQKLL